jgi:hypothetical protein
MLRDRLSEQRYNDIDDYIAVHEPWEARGERETRCSFPSKTSTPG